MYCESNAVTIRDTVRFLLLNYNVLINSFFFIDEQQILQTFIAMILLLILFLNCLKHFGRRLTFIKGMPSTIICITTRKLIKLK